MSPSIARRARKAWRCHSPLIVLLAVLVVVSLTGSVFPGSASAAPVTKSDMAEAQSQAQSLEQKVRRLNDQVEIAVEKYDAANVRLDSLAKRMTTTKKEFSHATDDLAATRTKLAKRLADIYKQGHTSVLEVIATSGSVSEMVGRLRLLERTSKEDKQLVDHVGAYRAKVEKQEGLLASWVQEQKKQTAMVAADKQAVEAQLASSRQALQGQRQEVIELERTYQGQQARLVAQAKAAAAAEAARAKAAAAAQAEAASQRQAALQAASAGPPQPVSSSSKGATVVQLAMKYLGVPYVWGGATPSGFDCSGLVMYVFAKLGVSLPHYAASQYNYGTHVSRSRLQPGDLVFFGSPAHHVGIYVGDGNMIDAPHTGAVVRVDPLFGDYSGATRIF